MSLSTSQAATELGVSPRQVRRAAANGRIVAVRAGAAHAFSQRQVQALERTAHRGRDWSVTTQQAALDLLTAEVTSTAHSTTTLSSVALSSSARSRLKQRIRSSEVGALAGHILRGRVSLRRAASDETKQSLRSSLAGELGLSAGGGLGVLVSEDAARAARKARLGLDDSGDIAVVEGNERHRRMLEALALYVYGDARESSAAAAWISSAQEAV